MDLHTRLRHTIANHSVLTYPFQLPQVYLCLYLFSNFPFLHLFRFLPLCVPPDETVSILTYRRQRRMYFEGHRGL